MALWRENIWLFCDRIYWPFLLHKPSLSVDVCAHAHSCKRVCVRHMSMRVCARIQIHIHTRMRTNVYTNAKTWPVNHTKMWEENRVSHVTHMSESRHTYVWVTSHIGVCPVTHSSTGIASCRLHVALISESCHIYRWVTSHIWVSHVAHTSESHEYVTGK